MSTVLRCPVCRAELNDSPQCRRCRADLALLAAVEQQRRGLLARAREQLREGRPSAAHSLVEQAAALQPAADGHQLAALAHLLRRNFSAAWRAYQQAKRAPAR
jgi:hypothetical protein